MSNLSGLVNHLRGISNVMMLVSMAMPSVLSKLHSYCFLKAYNMKEQDWIWDNERYYSIIPEVCR